ncbi:hypothetical protein [Sporosarcina sp. BP05]|nr:hypothetical protein [Sporosarcina sp. BP05]
MKNYPLNKDGLIESTKPDSTEDSLHQVDESIALKISWEGKEEVLNLKRK